MSTWRIRTWQVPREPGRVYPADHVDPWDWTADDAGIYIRLDATAPPLVRHFEGRATSEESARRAAEAAVDAEGARRAAGVEYNYEPKEPARGN